MNKLRVFFMGTPDFAVPSCEAIYNRFDLVGVATQPDRPKGRGGKMAQPPIKEFALAHNIPVWQPTVLKDGSFQEVLDETKPDLIVVAAYGRILPAYILNYPRFGCINVHGSLLPAYRGAAPIQRAVINGDSETGVTIMKMDIGMDTGDMILKASVPISNDDTAGTIFDKLSVLGADLLIEAIGKIIDGTAEYIKQDESKATYAPMIEKNEGKIDFSKNAATLRNLIMGMNPSPGAFLDFGDYRLKIHTAQLGQACNFEFGEISSISKAGIEVACGDQTSLLIQTIQKQGKNKMDAYAYACGSKLVVGEKLR